MSSKICGHCGIDKVLAEFSVNRALKDGLSHICKGCQKIKNKKHYDANAEERRAYSRDYRKEHIEERNVYMKQWVEDHREAHLQWHRDYNAAHPKERTDETRAKAAARARERYATDEDYRARCLASSKASRARNPEKVAARMRAWVDANREYVREYQRNNAHKYRNSDKAKAWKANYRIINKVKIQTDNNNYRAMREGAEGSFSNEHLFHLHKWQDHRCFYCREDLAKKDTVEHIIPLAREGTNHPHNIVLSCGPCNFSKQDRLLGEWYPKQIADVDRQHSVHWTKEIWKAVKAEGVEAESVDDVIRMTGGDVLVLSSFWNQEAAPANPNTLVIYDFEWWQDPETVLAAILFGEPVPALAPGYVGPDGYTADIDIEDPEARGLFFIEGLPERVMTLTAAELLIAA